MNKKTPAILLALITISGLAFAVATASALPITAKDTGSPSATTQGMPMMPRIPVQRSYVMLNGVIDTWGQQDVNGTITAMTSTTSASAVPVGWLDSASAIWTNTTNFRQDGNFSYNYYAARLVKANFTMVDFQANDFYLNGTWSVANVTITREVIKTGDPETGYSISTQSTTSIIPLETKVYGELNVTNQWTQFTLNITGIPLLSGTVHRSVERQMMFNRFNIFNEGTNNAGTTAIVTRVDLTTISNDYGAVPGMSNYDESMDFHGTYRIDICDLATVAANVQQ
ncbi:MAG: hypothetical protein ABSA75_04175 [Candidatus Bathyarchaeia archaeon]